MAEMTKEFAERINEAGRRGEHSPLTAWEESQLAHGWLQWQAHITQPAQAVDVGAARLQARADEIERAIACGEMDVYQVFTQMRQLLPRALSAEKAGWRDMDSAPKDGTEVLLRVELRAGIPGRCLVGHYMRGGHCIEDHPPIDAGWYFWNGCMFDKAAKPLQWAPLPASPTPDREGRA